MNYKTHITGGLIASSLYAVSKGVEPIAFPIVLTMGGLGALIPDLDHPNSYLGRRLKITSFLTSKAFGHRGVTHVPSIMGLVTFLFYKLFGRFVAYIYDPVVIFQALYVGIFSHIFLDMFNRMGVPMFYPISGKYISFGSIKVNSFKETIVRYLLYFMLLIIQFNIIFK